MAVEITVPRAGWSTEEVTFIGWLKGDGEPVMAGEVLFTVESEKATQDIESLDSGILRIPSFGPKPGAVVKVGRVIGYLTAEGEATPLPSPNLAGSSPTVKPSSPSPVAPVGASGPRLGRASPRARRAAQALGVDLAALQGSGTSGRICERDVRAASVAASPVPVREWRITPLRRTIAEHLVRSRKQTVPVTLTCRVDASNLVGLRRQFKAAGGDSPAPSYTDMLVKLVALALKRQPRLGGRWDVDRVVLPTAIHIGVAVDTEDGLVVPVIRNVLELSLPELARRSRSLVEAARARRLKPEDFQGGIFTVTNLGAYGVEAFTPIINFPETAILGLGVIRREPVALEDGSLTVREQMTLSLTFDHRVVDGAPAARFLQTLRQEVEDAVGWLRNDQAGGGPTNHTK